MMPRLDELREWLDVGRAIARIFIIWGLAWILWSFLRGVFMALRNQIVGRITERHDFRRIDTLTSVFRYTTSVVIVAMAVMLTLSELGISITPILATAGVAGIAVGFGAQSLVKDFFNGLFLLIENQVSEGDIIEAAGKSGYVERVTLRHIRIRDYDGSVHFIPNGMITLVTNRSRDYVFAVIDLTIPRTEKLDEIFESMRTISSAMRQDSDFGVDMLDDIDIAGVEKLEDARVVVRCRIKVRPTKQWRVRREFLRRMKCALDAVDAEK
jgi:moderate conductance mechanosensitive channel